MSNESSTIVQRLWNYCNVLRDDGMSYSDYVEQLICQVFLKLEDENVNVLNKPSLILSRPNWMSCAGCRPRRSRT